MFYNKKIFQRHFPYKGRYWVNNIAGIPKYFRALHHLVKQGYDDYAVWETFDWFVNTMRSILTQYQKYHLGVPVLIENYPLVYDEKDEAAEALRQKNTDLWEGIIARMLELLDLMDENNPKYERMRKMEKFKEVDEQMEQAKDEFFSLFSEHFYKLWD